MSLRIPVAHDFICPWCWIALSQAKTLQSEFDVEFDWLAYELMPEELPWPEPAAAPSAPTDRPRVPSRLDLAYAAEGLEPPTAVRPKRMRSHNALEAMEHAKSLGLGEPMLERLYSALYNHGREINSLETIRTLSEGLIPDVDSMIRAIERRRYRENIVAFDDDAHRHGVYNVPTFWIGGERYAEQPIGVLRQAIRRALSEENR